MVRSQFVVGELLIFAWVNRWIPLNFLLLTSKCGWVWMSQNLWFSFIFWTSTTPSFFHAVHQGIPLVLIHRHFAPGPGWHPCWVVTWQRHSLNSWSNPIQFIIHIIAYYVVKYLNGWWCVPWSRVGLHAHIRVLPAIHSEHVIFYILYIIFYILYSIYYILYIIFYILYSIYYNYSIFYIIYILLLLLLLSLLSYIYIYILHYT